MAEKLIPAADWNANAPGDGDAVIIPPSNVVNVITNVDQKGDYYATMEAGVGFMHNVASAGTYARFNSAVLNLLHGGDAWIVSDDNNGAGSESMGDTLVRMMNPSHHAHLSSSANAMHADSDWHGINIEDCTCTVESSVIFAAAGFVTVSGAAKVILEAEAGNGTTLPTLSIDGGMVECDKTVTYASVMNGTLRVDTNPVATIDIGPGGIVKYWHTAGTLIVVHAGGHLDLREHRRLRAIPNIIIHKGGMLSGYTADLHTGTLTDLRDR